jgi:hypothetical protein
MCFFERRVSVMMRAIGSPKTPRTVGWGRKPGKTYASVSRRDRLRERAIGQSCQISGGSQHRFQTVISGIKPLSRPDFYPH